MVYKTEDMDMIGGGSRFPQSYLWLYIKEKEIIELGDGQFGFATQSKLSDHEVIMTPDAVL